MNEKVEINIESSYPSIDPALAYVVFRCGLTWYSVPIRHVVSAATHTRVVRVPGTRMGIVGIAHFQGKIITAIDILPCFGIREKFDYAADHGMLVVKHGQEVIGIVADEIGEAVSISDQQLKPVTEVLGSSRKFVLALANLRLTKEPSAATINAEDHAVVVIDLEAILQELCGKK